MNAELVRLGLEFEVGNGGSRLSYSQRQRLAIARAIMKNPDILVFNEPTSGLDPATESRVLGAVLDWAKGRTVVWALGRADLARAFDRVLRPRRRPARRAGDLRRARASRDARCRGCSADDPCSAARRRLRRCPAAAPSPARRDAASPSRASRSRDARRGRRVRGVAGRLSRSRSSACAPAIRCVLAAGEYRDGLPVHGLVRRAGPADRHLGTRARPAGHVRRAARTQHGQHRRFAPSGDSQSGAGRQQPPGRRREGRATSRCGAPHHAGESRRSAATATISRPSASRPSARPGTG